MKTAAEAMQMQAIATGGWWEVSPITRPSSPDARLLRPDEYDLTKDPPWFAPDIQDQITRHVCNIEVHNEIARRVEGGNVFYTNIQHTGRTEVWIVPHSHIHGPARAYAEKRAALLVAMDDLDRAYGKR